jgi:predicted nucleic acid-binding protein
MNLEQVLNGSTVFIDANIFIYAVGQKSQQCRQLLRRCASRAVTGKTTTAVIAEVCHRRMLIEARAKGILPAKATPQDLAKKRTMLTRLTDYEQEVRDLLAGEVRVEPVLVEDFPVALVLQKQFGLLTNDSLNLAVAKRLGLTEIATADADFTAAQGFVVYSPDDLPGPLPSSP